MIANLAFRTPNEPRCPRRRKTLRLAALVIVLLSAVCSFGQASEKLNKCLTNAETQSELNKCASDDAARADADLKASFKELLTVLNGDPTATAKVKEAERLWIRYRDAYIEAMFPAVDKQAAYGTEYPMDVNLLRAKLTREHQSAIADLKADYQPTI